MWAIDCALCTQGARRCHREYEITGDSIFAETPRRPPTLFNPWSSREVGVRGEVSLCTEGAGGSEGC